MRKPTADDAMRKLGMVPDRMQDVGIIFKPDDKGGYHLEIPIRDRSGEKVGAIQIGFTEDDIIG